MKTARISARITEDAARKLREIASLTGEDYSETVIKAIEDRYAKLVAEAQDPWTVFEKAGFLGAFPGEAELSTNYKQELTKILNKKHGHN